MNRRELLQAIPAALAVPQLLKVPELIHADYRMAPVNVWLNGEKLKRCFEAHMSPQPGKTVIGKALVGSLDSRGELLIVNSEIVEEWKTGSIRWEHVRDN